MRRWLLFSAWLILSLSGAIGTKGALAQALLTGGVYTQDFNTLAASGNSNTTVPTGWAFSESGSNANTTYTAGTGSANQGETYSFGASSAAERAFGGLRSSNVVSTIGASFQNQTGGAITRLVITYVGEEWRLGENTGRTDQLDFQYSLNATSLTTGTWTDVNALDFVTPNTTGSTSGANAARDGNAAANRTRLSSAITGLNIANNATFWIRWTDPDATGSDDGLAVDEFVLVPDPATITQTATGGAGWRMLAPSVAGMDVDDLAALNLVQGVTGQYPDYGDNLFLGYTGNNSGTNNGFVAATSTTDILVPGRGFIWYFYDANFGPFPGGTSVSQELPDPLTGTGAPASGTPTVTFQAADRGTPDDRFYLLGNPFAAPFDLSGLSVSSGGLQATFEVWNPNAGGGAGSYQLLTVSNEASPNSTADDLAPWQGVFAQLTAAPTFPVTFTYNATHQVVSTPPFYARTEPLPTSPPEQTRRVTFALVGETSVGSTYDEAAVVAFIGEAGTGWDRYDASKLFPFSSPVAVIAPVGEQDGAPHPQALRSLPYELIRRPGQQVPLALYTTDDGIYTLSWALEGIPNRWQLRLRDAVTGEEVDLRTASSHTFSAAATGAWTDRFTLLIAPAPLAETRSTLPGAYGLSAVYPNPSRGAAHFTVRVAEAQAVTVALYDVLGRQVALLHDGVLQADDEHAFTIEDARLAGGTYVVRVEGETFTEARRLTLLR